MSLRFEFGNPQIFLYDLATTGNDALWAATRAMVNRMRDELWGYFGLAVTVGGSWPTLTLDPASGGSSGALRVARAQLSNDDASWQVARGRLEALIRGDGAIRGQLVRVSLRRFSNPGVLMGWDTLQTGHIHAGPGQRLLVNPYTYFLANGSAAMRYSSERARAAESATLHLLHELTHLWGPMFASSVDPDEETTAVRDVDSAARAHRGIGLRLNYRGLPGMRTYLDANFLDESASQAARPNTEWVIWPMEATLRSGAASN